MHSALQTNPGELQRWSRNPDEACKAVTQESSLKEGGEGKNLQWLEVLAKGRWMNVKCYKVTASWPTGENKAIGVEMKAIWYKRQRGI